MADEATASGLRDDRNVCQLCGALENLSLCGGCRDTWYCCKDHQRAHWKQHKQQCKTRKQAKVHISTEAPLDANSNTASSSVPCWETTEKQTTEEQTTGSQVVTSQSTSQTDTLSLSPLPESSTSREAATGSCFAAPSSSCPAPSAVSSFRFVTPQAFQQQAVPKSLRSSTKTSGSSAGRREVVETQPLPAIAEEGTNERYFLDARPFSQHLQSPRQVRWRPSPSAMAPQSPDNLDRNSDTYLKVMNSRFSTIASYVVDCLNKYGICVIDQFMGDATGQEILSEVKELKTRGVMRQGQVVQSSTPTADNIRGDIITWVDGRRQGSNTDNINYLVSCMDLVVQNCSSLMELYSINERTKAMVACYPGNATGYVRHVDNPSGDGRCITCIYYLNRDWDCKVDGGMLRIYPEGNDRIANIAPSFDRLLFFWSDRRNPHEVLPSMTERYAITVWYYEAEERARALKKFKGDPDDNLKKQAVPLFNGSGKTSL